MSKKIIEFSGFFSFSEKKSSSCEISPPKKTHQCVIILFLEVMVLIITIISKVLHMLDGPICRLRLGVQKYKTSNIKGPDDLNTLTTVSYALRPS
jgi:hypothetical protein